MEGPDGGAGLAMFFGGQVRDRRHLAQVLRSLRRGPDGGEGVWGGGGGWLFYTSPSPPDRTRTRMPSSA